MKQDRTYRKDIQGLRALAILSVLAYHLEYGLVSGGYIGVDVFFVISGYLITRIILGEMAAGRFSLKGFYRRRVLRLFPALFVVMGVTVLAGLLILPPGRLELLGKTVVATTLFVSNLYFFRTVDYFAVSAEWHPLLHTWTLSLEEQFYIVFPLVLIAARRWSGKAVRPVLWVGWAVSLAVATAMVWYKLQTGYFLPVTRAYELLTGCLVAAGAFAALRTRRGAEFATMAGLAAIAAALVFYDDQMVSPGFAGLAPATGCAVILLAGETRETAVSRFLGLRVLTFFGDISYSLYLWHWPILVYARYYQAGELAPAMQLACFAASVVLATLTYRLVERPMIRSGVSVRQALAGAAACVTIGVVVGGVLIAGRGFPGRFSPEALRLFASANEFQPERERCHHDFEQPAVYANRCVFGSDVAPSVAVWSDSFGAELAREFGSRLQKSDRAVLQLSGSSCPPSLGFTPFNQPDCARYNADVLRRLAADRRIGTVIMAANYLDYDHHARLLRGFEAAVATLTRAGKRVVIVYPVPHAPFSAPEGLGLYETWQRDKAMFGQPTREFLATSAAVRSGLDAIARRWSAAAIRPEAVLCTTDRCRAIGSDGQVLYFDDIHLSLGGARLLVDAADPSIFR